MVSLYLSPSLFTCLSVPVCLRMYNRELCHKVSIEVICLYALAFDQTSVPGGIFDQLGCKSDTLVAITVGEEKQTYHF